MLAFDPPGIWSIASGTAVTMNTPKSKYCGVVNRKSCKMQIVVSAAGRIEMIETTMDMNHIAFRHQLTSLYQLITTSARRLAMGHERDSVAIPSRASTFIHGKAGLTLSRYA